MRVWVRSIESTETRVTLRAELRLGVSLPPRRSGRPEMTLTMAGVAPPTSSPWALTTSPLRPQ